MRKALSPRRRWRREVRFCLYDGKSLMHSPRFARGAGRCSLGALHAVCAAARVIHHAGDARCGCSISADVRIKGAAPPRVNYALMFGSCNGSRQHFPGLLRARHVDRSADARQFDFDAALLRGRRLRGRNRCGFCISVLRPRSNSPPPLSSPEGDDGPMRIVATGASGSGRCSARLPQPAGLAFGAAKLSINAENPGTETTTR